jgi:hypothetical protein
MPKPDPRLIEFETETLVRELLARHECGAFIVAADDGIVMMHSKPTDELVDMAKTLSSIVTLANREEEDEEGYLWDDGISPLK